MWRITFTMDKTDLLPNGDLPVGARDVIRLSNIKSRTEVDLGNDLTLLIFDNSMKVDPPDSVIDVLDELSSTLQLFSYRIEKW